MIPAPYQHVFQALASLGKVTGIGPHWGAHCPGHDDRKQSLSVSLSKDGKLLLRCHAPCRCPIDRILRRLNLTLCDLFPDNPRSQGMSERTYVESYQYRDAAGKVLMRVVRWHPKSFSQSRPNPEFDPKKPKSETNREWLPSTTGVPRVLYKLPELLSARKKSPNRWVFIPEGEKDVDLLWKIGVVATTNPGGALKWSGLDPDTVKQALTGANVVVIPDFDPINPEVGFRVGLRHATDVCEALKGIAGSVRLLELPEIQEGQDFFDWWHLGLQKGMKPAERRNELGRLASACPLYQTPPAAILPLNPPPVSTPAPDPDLPEGTPIAPVATTPPAPPPEKPAVPDGLEVTVRNGQKIFIPGPVMDMVGLVGQFRQGSGKVQNVAQWLGQLEAEWVTAKHAAIIQGDLRLAVACIMRMAATTLAAQDDLAELKPSTLNVGG